MSTLESAIAGLTVVAVLSITASCQHHAGLEKESVRSDLNPVTFLEVPQHKPVVIVDNEKPIGNICVMKKPEGSLKMVVDELSETIFLTTGANIPVIEGKIQKPAIVIGDCPEAARNGLVGKNMPVEGFEIKTSEEMIFIVGNDEKVSERIVSTGTAWGVIEFMERFLDVRWYWHKDKGGRSLRKTNNLSVNPVHLKDSPVFRKRHNYPPVGRSIDGKMQDMRHYYLMMRNANTWPVSIAVHQPQPGTWEHYRKERPEIFAVRTDGTRHSHMYCYSHPLTLQTFLEEIDAHYSGKKLPTFTRGGASFIVEDAISVSPPDLAPSCYCDRCQKLWKPEAGQYGAASYLIADFVKRLSAEVKKRWPDKVIIYLPYQNYTETPEGVRFSGNVEVQICGMPGIAQYKEPEIAAWEQKQIERWYKITGRKIQNWHYSCWPADRTRAPYQFPHVLQDYYRKNRDILVGTFINGTEDNLPRHHISIYIWNKLLWNPDFDVDTAIDNYVSRMYGPASKPIAEIVQILIDGWENSRWPDANLTPAAIYKYSYPPEKMERIKELFDTAREKAEGDKTVMARLDYFMAPFKAFFDEYNMAVYGEGVRPFTMQKVGEDPVIDGKLNDAVWKRAVPFTLSMHTPPQGEKKPVFKTEVRAVWTLDSVTFGLSMEEPETDALVKDIKARDAGMMWHQDCIEIFLDTTGENNGNFYQFIINAAGAIWDAAPGGRDGRGGNYAWNIEGMKTGVYKGDRYWSMEVLFPIVSFSKAKRPGTGVSWYGQITRHRNGKGKSIGSGENQKLNAVFGGRNNNIADFAPFQFIE